MVIAIPVGGIGRRSLPAWWLRRQMSRAGRANASGLSPNASGALIGGAGRLGPTRSPAAPRRPSLPNPRIQHNPADRRIGSAAAPIDGSQLRRLARIPADRRGSRAARLTAATRLWNDGPAIPPTGITQAMEDETRVSTSFRAVFTVACRAGAPALCLRPGTRVPAGAPAPDTRRLGADGGEWRSCKAHE